MLIGLVFGFHRSRLLLPHLEDAMNQLQPNEAVRQREPTQRPPAADRDAWLNTEQRGREILRTLIEQWLLRNGWSLAVTSRLAELALLATSQEPVPDWIAGMPLANGDWVNHGGHAWEAIGTPASEPVEGATGWRDVGLTSRLHASGLNLFLRRRTRSLTSTFLLELGRLNQWVACVQQGRKASPTDTRLADLVLSAVVLTDDQGVLGPEELLSIAVDTLPAPRLPGTTDGQLPGQAPPCVPARELRRALGRTDLDIAEDWETIAAMYPTDDPLRLEQLREVLQGRRDWDAQQQEDERVAITGLLEALQERQAKLEAAANTSPVAVPAAPPGEPVAAGRPIGKKKDLRNS